MAQDRAAPLYTPEILALAVSLANSPLRPHAMRTGTARSDTCGSELEIGFDLGPDGTIDAPGIRATACAIGQAAGAIFLADAAGRTPADLERANAELVAWLAGDGPTPSWRGMEQLDAARAYPARHGAIRLPWRAAIVALCKGERVR